MPYFHKKKETNKTNKKIYVLEIVSEGVTYASFNKNELINKVIQEYNETEPNVNMRLESVSQLLEEDYIANFAYIYHIPMV